MTLVDANLLIYAVNRNAPHHGRAPQFGGRPGNVLLAFEVD